MKTMRVSTVPFHIVLMCAAALCAAAISASPAAGFTLCVLLGLVAAAHTRRRGGRGRVDDIPDFL